MQCKALSSVSLKTKMSSKMVVFSYQTPIFSESLTVGDLNNFENRSNISFSFGYESSFLAHQVF